MNDEDYLRLLNLSKDELITILTWTINDLDNWSKNPSVDDKVQGYSAMLLEAVWYQVSKAEDKSSMTVVEALDILEEE